MHVEAYWDVVLHLLEKFAELLCAMPRRAFADHATCLQIRLGRHRGDKTCEQRCGGMAPLVVRTPFDLRWAHRQQRLSAVEGLDLALLVDADDQRLLRRI
jgi:hypothetical protein